MLAALLWSAICGAAPAVPPAALTGVCSAIVYDLDHDAILFEQNPDERIPPASLTKVMSMFLAMDHVASGNAAMSDLVDISPAAAATSGSRMGLRPNEQVSLARLLMGMAVSSGNDASHAVAEYVGGSTSAFVGMMNNRARQLGMMDSNFMNPHGLPAEGQYTTARDMLTLGRAYLMAHPDALKFHNTLVLEHGGYKSWNKNPLIGQYPGADGLKTGWIRASGYNMIFTARRDGRRLLAVILGAPDTYTRGAEACRLLDAGFRVCANDAVSVAAALDSIPLDLNRIDPRKTAKDHGITKPARARATLLAKSNKRLRNTPVAERMALAKKRLHNPSRLERMDIAKNSKRAATPKFDRAVAKKGGKAKDVRLTAKQKAHASTRHARATRG